MKKENKAQKEDLFRTFLPILVFLLLYEILQAGLTLLADWIIRSGDVGAAAYVSANENSIRTLITGISMAGAVLPLIRILKEKTEAFGAAVSKQRPGGNQGLYEACGLFLSLSLAMGVNILLLLSVQGAGGNAAVPHPVGNTGLGAALAVYAAAVPFAEEAVFRGILYTGLRMKFPEQNKALCALGSAALFAVWHADAVQGIYAFVMGFAFCLLYDLSGRFVYVFLLHAACNLLSVVLDTAGVFSGMFRPGICAMFLGFAFIAGAALFSMIKKGKGGQGRFL